MGNYEYWNYKDLGFNSTYKPGNIHMWIETNSNGTIYLAIGTIIYKTINKCKTWTTITTEIYNIKDGFYYDRPNSRVYYSCSDPLNRHIKYIDLTDDSITTVTTGAFSRVSKDLWIYDSNVWMLMINGQDACLYYYDGANHIYDQQITASSSTTTSYALIIGTLVYFLADDVDNNELELWTFDMNTKAFNKKHTITAGSMPSSRNLQAISYDDSDFLYFIADMSGTNKLYMWQISTSSMTALGNFDICLMLNNNTDSSADFPNNLEKGFHISEDKICQIPSNYGGKLNTISKNNFLDVIKGVTDHFLIDNSGNVYEYVDLFDSIFTGFISHSRNDFPHLEMKYNSDDITIKPQQFVQIIGPYTANDSDRLFYGTYNFGDEVVGTSGTDIGFVDTVVLYNGACEIISDWQGHKKVLRVQDDATAAEDPQVIHNETQATAGTREFYIGTNDVIEEWQFHFYEAAHDYIVYLRINASNLQYRDNADVWQTIQAVANDTLYHLKVVWRADNTFDVYVDGILKVDNQATNNNMVSGINRFYIRCYGDSEDYIYLDAYGDPDNDANYNVGDNQYAEEGEENQVVFEGIAKKPTKGRIQYVLVENQGSEMDQVQPYGSKAGRTDQIITDINNDGSPNGPEYIRDGTLSAGGAMGTLALEGAKDYREVVDDFAEHDGFLWSLRPQGQLDYNDGSINSDAVIRFDGSTYTDPILQMKAWTIAKLNQIIVNGAISSTEGVPYTGQWDDDEDQQENGINSVTIEDAQLNSDALCQAKADTMGGSETERTRARFKFRKTGYGFIQPGQTITFKYDITNYITISEAQFIVDKSIINIKSELGYMEISSGL